MIAFASTRDGDVLNAFWTSATGGGQVERLTAGAEMQIPSAFSRDGRTLLFSHLGAVHTSAIGAETDSEYPTIIERGGGAVLSPDGRWVAYTVQGAQGGIYVRPYPNVDEGLWPISDGLVQTPVWGPDGRELFFLYSEGPGAPVSVMVVAIDTEPAFRAGPPTTLFEGPYLQGRSFDTQDGRRFLMIKDNSEADRHRLVVVQNWFEELKSLVPVE